jgi:hypothetical protein
MGMSYDPGDLVALEAELIVALEYAKVTIEDVREAGST